MVRAAQVRRFGRLAVLGGGVFLSFASNSPAGGDRTDGECPAGEVCSPDTPTGLYFGGSVLGDEIFDSIVEPHRTAVAGTQTLDIFSDADASDEFIGFDAVAAGPSFQVVAVAGNQVSVAGVAGGTDFLRLVDPESGELYDRIALQTAVVDTIAIVPQKIDLLGDQELYDAASPAVVYHASGTSELVVALYDASDVRLVDETLTLALGTGFVRDTAQWDRFEHDPVAPGTYVFTFTLGSGEIGDLSATFVDAVDAVVWVPGLANSERAEPASGAVVGQQKRFCFRAENGGRPVVGATFGYTSTSGLTVASGSGTCVTVTGAAPGLATLTVSVDGVAEPFDVPVASAANAQPASAANAEAQAAPVGAGAGAGAGERAESSARLSDAAR